MRWTSGHNRHRSPARARSKPWRRFPTHRRGQHENHLPAAAGPMPPKGGRPRRDPEWHAGAGPRGEAGLGTTHQPGLGDHRHADGGGAGAVRHPRRRRSTRCRRDAACWPPSWAATRETRAARFHPVPLECARSIQTDQDASTYRLVIFSRQTTLILSDQTSVRSFKPSDFIIRRWSGLVGHIEIDHGL